MKCYYFTNFKWKKIILNLGLIKNVLNIKWKIVYNYHDYIACGAITLNYLWFDLVVIISSQRLLSLLGFVFPFIFSDVRRKLNMNLFRFSCIHEKNIQVNKRHTHIHILIIFLTDRTVYTYLFIWIYLCEQSSFPSRLLSIFESVHSSLTLSFGDIVVTLLEVNIYNYDLVSQPF